MRLAHQLRLTAANRLASWLPYTSYAVDEREYLGTFDGTLDECVDELLDRGYHYQLLAATKQHAERDHIDSGSFARIPNSHPYIARGTGLGDRSPGECQYHVHLFELDDEIELYGHYEIHPYPHTPHWDLTRSYPHHYRPTWNDSDVPREEWTYLRGIVDEQVRDFLYAV